MQAFFADFFGTLSHPLPKALPLESARALPLTRQGRCPWILLGRCPRPCRGTQLNSPSPLSASLTSPHTVGSHPGPHISLPLVSLAQFVQTAQSAFGGKQM